MKLSIKISQNLNTEAITWPYIAAIFIFCLGLALILSYQEKLKSN